MKALTLALSPERGYFSLTVFPQNYFNILICSSYLYRSIFSHFVQIVYSDIDKKHRYLYFFQLWAKDVGAGLWWKAKVSFNYSNRKYFHAHLYKFKFFLDRRTNSWIVVFLELWSGLKITMYFCFEKSWWNLVQGNSLLWIRNIRASRDNTSIGCH